MKAVLDGPAPTWVRGVTDAQLRQQVGAGAFTRGAGYASSRAVQSLTTGEGGRMLLGSVRGSGPHAYSTLVRAQPVTPGRPVTWSGRCSCPMQVDCKHVAAVVLATRRWLTRLEATTAAPPAVPAWERQLAELVRPASARDSRLAPLALQVEVVTREPSRFGPDVPVTRIGLRPLTLGRSGNWIKSGVSWRDLSDGYRGPQAQREHRAAALAILAMAQARTRSSASYGELTVHLDELGRGGWPLLQEAVDAGVRLVAGGRGAVPVQLAEGAATVTLDLRREPDGAEAVLTAVLQLPGFADHDGSGALLQGDPAHGVALRLPDRLLLAPLAAPLDGGTARLVASGRLTIPAVDLPRFVQRYVPALRRRLPVGSADGSVELAQVRPPRLVLQVDFQDAHVTRLCVAFGYGPDEAMVLAAPDEPDPDLVRDDAAERALLARTGLLELLPELRTERAGTAWIRPECTLSGLRTASFVAAVLPRLETDDDVLLVVAGTPAAYVEAADAPLISVSAHDAEGCGTDWFDLAVTVTVAGEQVPFTALFTALALGESHLVLDSGTWFALDRPELHELRRLIESARTVQDRDPQRLRVSPLQAGLWEELVSLGVVASQSERWTRTAGALLQLDELPTPPAPAALRAELRPYQLAGYHWLSLLWDLRLGGVLADDMGLGKTVQTLAMAARASEQGTLGGDSGPLLIVAPTSVVSTWAREAARFCPDLNVVTITETERRSGVPVVQVAAGAHLVVTSYALLRIDEDGYRAPTWAGLVLDEAQFVKNSQAKTYQCARRLEAPFKLAITGTPLENSLMDLWSMLSITAPGLFPSPQRFTELYRTPIESGSAPEQLASLRRRIRPLMLRRTKEQVALDLPPKVEQVLEVTLNPAHRRLYDRHLARERTRVLGLVEDLQRNRIAILRSLTVLRQLSLDASLVEPEQAGVVRSSKIDALLEQLVEVVQEGHRALVFSQFTGFLALVRERLAAEGIEHVYLDGRTRDRPRRIAEFTDGDAPVFCISLKAGGFGLTLTEADYVFVLDPWWNPAAEAQAVDRTHRIGQQRTVMVYRLVAADTIEQKVVALQQRKRDLFRRVVDGGALSEAALSADDIRGLFDD